MKTIDNDIKAGTLKRSYLLYGEETYLIRQYRDKLKKAFFPEPDTMNMSVFKGQEVDEKQIIDLAETLPFFVEYRLIVIENSGLFKKGGEALAEYLPEAPETTHFIFVEDEVDGRSKLYKAACKIGSAVEFKTPSEDVLMKWVLAKLKREGSSITQQAYQLFLAKTGTDMENMDRELEKLLCYTMGRDTIGVSDVEAITTEQVQNKIFEMVNAIATKQQKRALELYYDLLSLQEEPMGILILLTKQFDTLLAVKSMANKGYSDKEIASTTGRKDWQIRKSRTQCKAYSLEQLKQAVTDGVEYETAVKRGNLSAQLAAELFIVQYSGVQAEKN